MVVLTRKRLRELLNTLPGYTAKDITRLFIEGKIK